MENESDPEVIRKRMLENRTQLTEKLEALEQQVMGVASSVTDTVESVKDGVQETVEAVKDSFTGTVDSVKETVADTVESVKETFDLSRQFERHPLLMLGGSVGVGLLLGALLRRRTVERVGRAAGDVVHRFRGAAQPAPVPAEEPHGNGARKESSSGVTAALLGPVQEGLTRVKDMALGTLFDTLQRLLVREMPEAVGEQVKSLVDNAASRLKGAFSSQQQQPAEEETQQGRRRKDRQETGFHPETGRPMGPPTW